MDAEVIPWGIVLFLVWGAVALVLELRKRSRGEASDAKSTAWAIAFLLVMLVLGYWENTH